MPGYGDPLAAESRAIGARCGGVDVWSLYVPNGRKPDDPHYVYKLDWLARLREAARAWLDGDTALVGDWNICPTDDDVFDPAQFQKSTHVTPPERAAFQGFLDDGYVEVHPRARAGLHLLGLLPPALRARPRPQDRLRGRLALARRAGEGRVHRPRRARPGAGHRLAVGPRAGGRRPGPRLSLPAVVGGLVHARPMDLLTTAVTLLVGLVLGALIGLLWARSRPGTPASWPRSPSATGARRATRRWCARG